MRAYLSTPQKTDSGQLLLDGRTELYRDPDKSHEIIAECEGNVIGLGIADATVSRKKGATAPVVIEPRPDSIEISNNANSNGVTITTGGERHTIEKGFMNRIQRDALIELGYQTTLRLTVEQEAKEEYVVEGDIETSGDVVFGNQHRTSVDRSTSVGDDNIINRSDLGEEEPATVGDDNVVNRSNADESDPTSAPASTSDHVSEKSEEKPDSTATQRYCNTHQTAYTGAACPDCASGHESTEDASTQPSGDSDDHCTHCGTEVPETAKFCLNCGEPLSGD